MHPKGLDPISSPDRCFPFLGAKHTAGAGGSFCFGPVDLGGRRILGTRGSAFARLLCSEVGAIPLYLFFFFQIAAGKTPWGIQKLE